MTSASHSQIDFSQLDSLQQLQQERLDVVDQQILNETKVSSSKKDLEENEEDERSKYIDDFGYQGRDDFLVEPTSKFPVKPLDRFGYEYFDNEQEFISRIQDVPIPNDYVLGPSDIVKIILYGNQNKRYTLQITREGDIFLPEIGPISVAGLNFQDAKAAIKQIINNQLIGTQATITLGELRSINIFVLGEASNPGMYTVSALSTLTNAVFSNGGLKKSGSLRNIQLKRNGETISNFDFYNLLLNGDTTDDIRLMSGDVVFIPPVGKLVALEGEVKRPAIYELRDNENAEDLIKFAGSVESKADLSSVELQRIDSEQGAYNLFSIDLTTTSFSKLELNDGDKLSIYPITDRINNAVLLRGHTPMPGFYPWKEGMRIRDIIDDKSDLLPMTDMNYVLVKRESNLGQGYVFEQVDLNQLLIDRNEKENILLMNRDEIFLFPSLLSLDLVRAVETEDSYENIDKKLSSHYIRKSLQEVDQENTRRYEEINFEDTADTRDQQFEKKYFHYYVHDYCVVPDKVIKELFEISEDDFTASNLIEEQLSKLNDENQSRLKEDNIKLTRYCRDQILDPIVAMIEQQTSAEDKNNFISVYGNVNFPGDYPLSSNSSVKDALAAAGGLRGMSYADEIDIVKKYFDGKSVLERNKIIKMDDIDNHQLDPLDLITVKKLGYETSLVTIQGEVHFPGVYPITENELLSDFIERVGGFKENAGIENTFFQRKSLIESDLRSFKEAQSSLRKQIVLASGQELGSSDDADEYTSKILTLVSQDIPDPDSLGRLVINFNNGNSDIKLMNDDMIIVPKKPETIKVIGEVFFPNTHIFQSEKRISDYIEMSGGLNDFADNSNIYVIKQNGSVFKQRSADGFFRTASNSIEAGDTIVIPIKINTFSNLKATTEITQIIYQMALSAAAVNSF